MRGTLARKGIAILIAVLMMFVSYGQVGLYSFADDTQTDQETVTTQEAATEQPKDTEQKEDVSKEKDPAAESTPEKADKPEVKKDVQEETKDAQADKDADKDKDEVKSKTLTAKAGGATITVKYDSDAFDGDVELVVKKVKEGSKEFEKAEKAASEVAGDKSKAVYAFDISFVNKKGNEVEPSKDVKVSIKLKKTPTKGSLDELELIHINDNGNAEKIKGATISENAANVEFKNDAFSIYVVTADQDGNVVVGDDYFTTLADAVAAASDGDTINVIGKTEDTGDVAVDKSLTILSDGADGSLTYGIDANGGTITLGGGSNTLTMGAVWATSEDDLTLNIEDGVHITGSLPLYIQDSNAELNIHGGKIEQTKARDNWNYAVGFWAGSFNEMTGGEIIALGGGIYNATIGTISGGKITAGEDGIYSCNIGTISDCEINAGNYGIYMGWNEIGTISGGTINAKSDAIYFYYSDNIGEISGGTFASENGSAINNDDSWGASTIGKISGGVFIGKSAISGESLTETIPISDGVFKATGGGDAIDSNILVDFTDGVKNVRWIGNLDENSYTIPDGYAPSSDTVKVDGVDGDFQYFAKAITVTYDGNGGKTSSNQTTFEESVTAKFKTAENSFIHPDEKAFKEWNTEADGSGTSYEEEGNVESEDNITLYAIWDDNEGPVSIGDVVYKNIRTAMAAAQDGDVISVNANCADSSDPIIVDKDVMIVAGDSKVKSSNANLKVQNGKKLVLGDGGDNVLTMTGTVDVAEGSLEFNDGITLKNTVTVSGGSSEAAIKGGKIAAKSFAIEVRDGATVTEISGGDLSSKNAAALFVRKGTVESISGENTSITADDDSAIVVWQEGEIKTIDNGKFISKKRSGYAAAVYVEGKLGTINDGFFEGYLGLQISGEERDAVAPATTQILGGEFYGKGGGRGNAINLGQIDNGNKRTYVVKNVKAVADNDFAIVVGHGNVVEEMSRVEATGGWGALRLYNVTYDKKITIGTISDSTFTYTGDSAYDFALEMGRNVEVDTIKSTVFDGGVGGGAEMGTWEGTESTVGTIEDCQFLGSSKGTGLDNMASIDTIKGTTITGRTALENGYKDGKYGHIDTLGEGNEFTGEDYAIDNIGPIDEITGGTYTGGEAALHNGRITEQEWVQDDDGVWGSEDVDKGPSKIQSITGGRFNGAIGIDNEGSITSITGPVKVTGTDGPAVQSAENGTINTISGEGVYEGIDNAIQINNDGHATDIEPGITTVIGDGRYQTGSNTVDSQFNDNKNVTIPAGYHVSNTTTALTRSGEYHFLVKDNTIIYDGNGHNLTDETKDQRVDGINGTDPVAKAYESQTATVAGNGDEGSFEYAEKKSDGTREGFYGWNTERDGSGTSYAAGDTLDFEALGVSDVRLYAQWGEYHGPVSINKAKEYPNIYEAMLEAKDGDIIYVNDDVTEPAGKTIDVTCEVTVVAGTHKEDSDKDTFVSTGAKFNVKEGGSLTMGGEESDNGHTLVLEKSEYTVNDKGAMTLNDLAEINSTESSAIDTKTGGTYTGNGGKVTTTGAYALYLESDSTVTEISGGEYEGDDCAVFGYGHIGEISDGTFTGKSAGMKLAAGTTIDTISGGTFKGTNSDGKGVMMRNASIGTISDGNFIGGTDNLVDHPNPNGYGLQIGPGSKVDLIEGGNFYAGWGVLIATGASGPLTITDGTFYGENTGLQVQKDTEVTLLGGTFTGALGFTNFGTITEVKDVTADGKSYGFINYGKCGDVKDSTFNAEKGAAIINSGYWIYGSMGNIIDCTVTSNGWGTLSNDYYSNTIESIQGGTFTGNNATTILNYGKINTIGGDVEVIYKGDDTEEFAVYNVGEIGEIESGNFTAENSVAIENTVESGSDTPGKIGTISGGTFTGTVAVRNTEEASIENIDIENLGDAVFTGTDGEAVLNDGGTVGKIVGAGIYIGKDNAINGADGEIPLEPGLTANPGYGRYQTDSNSADSQLNNEVTIPDGYHMSETTTSVNNQDGVFHYLVKDNTIIYDGNGHNLADDATYEAAENIDGTDPVFVASDSTKATVMDNSTASGLHYAEDDMHFVGWNTKADGSGKQYDAGDELDFEELGVSDIRLYAQWAWKVEFDTDGGDITPDDETDGKETAPDDQYVKDGDKATRPEKDPNKEGYTFVNWFEVISDGVSETAFDFTTEIKKNVELKAKYETVEYKITYDLDGGALEEGKTNPSKYTVESDDITLNNPTREGYTFEGWTGTDLDEATKDVTIAQGSTGDREYTATWEKKEYDVTFDADGGSPEPEDQKIKYKDKAEEPDDPTKEGHTFDGWFKVIDGVMDDEAFDFATDITENIALKAGWTPNEYTVSYDPNGGEGGPEDQDMTYNESSTIPSDEPTREGYTFTSWNTDKDGNGDSYKPGDEVKNLTSEDGDTVPLYAQWTPNEYTVSFDPNGGEGGPEDQDMTYDKPSKIPGKTPTREGYTFTGWNTDKDGNGDSYQPGDEVKNLTSEDGDTVPLYAQWKPNQYTITFDTDGGSKIDPITQDYGTDVSAPKDPTKTGYTFDGWDPELPDTMPAKDTTVKAKWTPNKYTVSFDANGGEGGPDNQNMTYDEPSNIPSDEPTREGYTFTGWNTEKDGSGDSYKPGDEVKNLSSENGDNVPLYAQWKINEYDVSFDSAGGSKVNGQKVKHGSTATKPSNPTRKGYTFKGWYLNGEEYDFSTPVTGALKLVAKWTENPKPTPTPTPEPTPTNPTRPTNGGGNTLAPTAPAVTNVLPTTPQVIDNNDVPLVEEPQQIEEPTVPLDVPEPEGHWALINLICTLLTIVGAIITLAKRREDDDEDDDNNGSRNVLFKAGNGAIAVASAVVLLITEHFTEPMQMVDKYTILMAVILAAGAVVTALSRRKKSAK